MKNRKRELGWLLLLLGIALFCYPSAARTWRKWEMRTQAWAEGSLGLLEIPEISVLLPIYPGVGEEILAKGAGHLPGSSLPGGGAGTHCVLTGHTGYPEAELFDGLRKLEPGDSFALHLPGQTLHYRIDRIRVVLPTETRDLLPEAGKDLCTLVTCTPYGINTHRLLVRGLRITEKETGNGLPFPGE